MDQANVADSIEYSQGLTLNTLEIFFFFKIRNSAFLQMILHLKEKKKARVVNLRADSVAIHDKIKLRKTWELYEENRRK